VIAYILRRLLQAIGVMLTVALVAFSLFNFVGDPVANMVGEDASQRDRDQMRQALGLNDPAPVRFMHFVGGVTRGEFGFSYRNLQPVSALIRDRLPATLELSATATVLALLLGVPAGIYCAIKRGGVLAQTIQTGSLVGISLPTFVTGILLILIFSVTLGWLPSFGRGDTVTIGWWKTGFLTASGLRSLILPAITLALFQTALIMRLVRAQLIEVLRRDFIKFARARGIATWSVHFRHALRNALVPVITIVGLQFGAAVAFAILTETVFQWPGMGLLFVQAVAYVDVPVMASYLVLVSFVFVTINLIVDLLYFAIDPRLRSDDSAHAPAR
jgi:peptide/nickel transport system permease protein